MEKLRNHLNSFSELNDEEWETFSKHIKIIDLPSNSTLLKIGQICEHVYFVEKGILKTFILDKKEVEQIAFIHFENEFLTEMESYLTQVPSRFKIESMTDVRLYAIKNNIHNAFREEVPILNKVGRIIAEWHCLSLRKRVEDLIFLTPSQRYLELIHKKSEIFQKLSLAYIAEYINIRPQSLSRIRKRISQ